MKKTEVVHVKDNNYDVYIGRGSKWGNPFVLGKDGNRFQVINKYREWIKTQQHLLNDLHELKGKKLGCHCKPMACHGDVLVSLIEEGNDDSAPL